MPWVEFEPTIPAFERAKTLNALDRAATVIGSLCLLFLYSYEIRNYAHCYKSLSDCTVAAKT
jgi:hypothetical protein